MEDVEEAETKRKKIRWGADVQEKDIGVNEDADVNEDKTTNSEDEVKGVEESSRSLSSRKRMR